MPTIIATEARKSFYKLLDEVSESHELIRTIGKRSNAVPVFKGD